MNNKKSFSHRFTLILILFICQTSLIIHFVALESLACSEQCNSSRSAHNSQSSLCHDIFPTRHRKIITLCNRKIDLNHEVSVRDVVGLQLESFGNGSTEVVCVQWM